ncbi:sel1 repeat family protein [Burkholderiales bacterium]|nr:sel1 repeat family protein [Burkholderiales bacterium]
MIRLFTSLLLFLCVNVGAANTNVESYKQSCDGGDVFSCGLLGSMYQWGDGVGHDALKAIDFYEKGCVGGAGYSCLMLGGMYGEGLGVQPNISEALKFLDMACEMKIEAGCVKSKWLRN